MKPLPSTCLGTIVKAAAAVAAIETNLRRSIGDFFTDGSSGVSF